MPMLHLDSVLHDLSATRLDLAQIHERISRLHVGLGGRFSGRTPLDIEAQLKKATEAASKDLASIVNLLEETARLTGTDPTETFTPSAQEQEELVAAAKLKKSA